MMYVWEQALLEWLFSCKDNMWNVAWIWWKCTEMTGFQFNMPLSINLWLKLVISILRNQIKIKSFHLCNMFGSQWTLKPINDQPSVLWLCDLLPAVEADTVCASFSSESMKV